MSAPRLVCWLLVLSVAPAAAQEWTHARSDHFEVYTTGGDRRAREALTFFERVRAFFAEVLMLAPHTDVPARLVIFSGEREFAPHRPNGAAVAYYLPAADRDYIVMRSLDADAYPLVVHEYVHLLLRHAGARYPAWLAEGLADFFSTMRLEISRVAVGVVPPGRLEYLADTGALMDLDRLFAVTHESPEYSRRSHVGVFYAQSWALTHMLLTEPRYHDGQGRFLGLMGAGAPTATALREAYGRSVAEVSRDLQAYIRREHVGGYRADFRAPAPPPVVTRRVEPFEARLILADLLASQRGREHDARATFDRLAEERPDDPALIESRALFELRAGERALPYLLRAAAVGSTRPVVYRALAALWPERAATFVQQGLARSPDDLDSRLHHALLLLHAGTAGQALGALAAAKAVPASRAFDYFQVMANVYLALDEFESGGNAARRAAMHARPGAETEYATRLLGAIEDARADPAGRRQRAGPWIPAPFVPGGGRLGESPSITITGRLESVRCAGRMSILEVATGSALVRLTLDASIGQEPPGDDEVAPDGRCGATDRDRLLRVTYVPEVDLGTDTRGRVRAID